MKIYSGIGSRTTPPNVKEEMFHLAKFLATEGWILRSGGAGGADESFEHGCDANSGLKEIYLPWKGFNQNDSPLFDVSGAALEYAKNSHPKWEALKSNKIRQFHARNVYQVLGKTLNMPVTFVICWTKDGCENDLERSIHTGGTGTAITIASRLNIPIYNLAKKNRFQQFLSDYDLIYNEQG